jgi:hypothetical protein
MITLQSSLDQLGEDDFSCDHPDAVRLMIDFMYFGDYEDTVSRYTVKVQSGRFSREMPVPIWVPNATVHDARLTTHARMHAMGRKYLCEALKTAAIGKYTYQIESSEIDADDFAASINIAYKTGDESDCGMTDCVFDTILKCPEAILSTAAVQDAIERVDGLPYKLFLKQLSANLQAKTKKRKDRVT